jgi:CheY-like chemotaxis protein
MIAAPVPPTSLAAPSALLTAGSLYPGDVGPPGGEVGGPPRAPRGAEGGTDASKIKPRALVVDDAPDVTEMLSFLLRYAGYDVVTVFSGAQALDAARSASFDVVVSDIGMPEMNGYELAERLRGFEQYRQTPMIAVTGFSMYDDRDKALAAGFDAFLTKPVNPRELVSLIERLRG